MASSVHAVAKQGFGSGNDLYDRARPSYQSNAITHIRQAIKAPGPVNIVEIGSGTGIFTRALLAHPEWSSNVGHIKAIEPSEGMRSVFSKTVKDERVTVAEGSFDATGVEDGWADVIIIAQAFHWCPDHDAAAREFARVLKPNGVVALIWNLEDRETAQWVAQLRDRIEVHEQGTPQFRLGLWRKFFDAQTYKAKFQAPREEVWSYHLPGTLEIVTERALSQSFVLVLPDDEKAAVVADIKNIIEKGDDLIWEDKEKGVFQYPYKTTVVVYNRQA